MDPSNPTTIDPEARADQLRDMYGLSFPEDFFEFWRWIQSLDDTDLGTFGSKLGMSLVGPFDVLRGQFDNQDLAYSAVLHWRYQFDPAEFVTVFSGDTDGLHWGLWFDAPGELPPVVSAFYARDAFELWHAGDTLFDAVRNHLDQRMNGSRENLKYDPDEVDYYQAELEAMARLRKQLPAPSQRAPRQPTHTTPEGMGVIAGDAAPKATELLLRGKRQWARGERKEAFKALEEAYTELGRPALAAIVQIHAADPTLPSVDILRYKRGHFMDLDKALKAPTEVRHLDLSNKNLTQLPDLSAMVHLETLSLPRNHLTHLPASLADCRQLTSINVWKNQFKEFPEVLLDLPMLTEIKLGTNPTERLPADIGRCVSLKTLELLGASLVELPSSIGDLVNLEVLNCAGCQLTSVPDTITQLRALRHLSLHKNQLSALPVGLEDLKALETLGLNGNPLPQDQVERLRELLPKVTISF